MSEQSSSFRAQAVTEALGGGELAIIAEGKGASDLLYLVAAGRTIEPDIVNRMAAEARGIIYLALSQEQARCLALQRLGNVNARRWSWGVGASIEARYDVGTGISAVDRARTIAVASSPEARPDDIVSPGHIFPVIAHPGGLITWQAIAEAAVESASLAGRGGAAAFCHILTDEGEAATWTDLPTLPSLQGLPVATISDILVLRHRVGDSFEQAFAAAFQ
jgi:3,4-dihydroxy 2-butanone 4-phosphate synthase / GTP cyclohydrolase II